jgi:hypothetical protein
MEGWRLIASRLVTETLQPLPDNRKCFRLINGVLVERTVSDVLPALKTNWDGLKQVLEELLKQYKNKEDEMNKWKVCMESTVSRDLSNKHTEEEQHPSGAEPVESDTLYLPLSLHSAAQSVGVVVALAKVGQEGHAGQIEDVRVKSRIGKRHGERQSEMKSWHGVEQLSYFRRAGELQCRHQRLHCLTRTSCEDELVTASWMRASLC